IPSSGAGETRRRPIAVTRFVTLSSRRAALREREDALEGAQEEHVMRMPLLPLPAIGFLEEGSWCAQRFSRPLSRGFPIASHHGHLGGASLGHPGRDEAGRATAKGAPSTSSTPKEVRRANSHLQQEQSRPLHILV